MVFIFHPETIERKESEKTTSHANEIVRSEKDIKALNLHEALKETSNTTYQGLRNAEYKMLVTNTCFWNFRNIIFNISWTHTICYTNPIFSNK